MASNDLALEKMIGAQDQSLSKALQIQIQPDLYEAEQFLTSLDTTARCFTFQTCDDARMRREPRLARILHGSLREHALELGRLNARGAGIFVCVNATDLTGRQARHITRVRAVWQDDDAGWSGKLPLAPSIVVHTSPRRFQRYWICDSLSFAEHRAVMERISRDFGNDPNAKDLARVLRLPGFLHVKNPDAPHFVRLVEGNRRRYRAHQILTAFPPFEMPLATPPRAWSPRSGDDQRVADALRRIPADDRETWWRVGMALRNRYGDAGREIWDEWSATSEKFDLRIQERVWRSFRRGGIGVGTIFHLAGARADVS